MIYRVKYLMQVSLNCLLFNIWSQKVYRKQHNISAGLVNEPVLQICTGSFHSTYSTSHNSQGINLITDYNAMYQT